MSLIVNPVVKYAERFIHSPLSKKPAENAIYYIVNGIIGRVKSGCPTQNYLFHCG
jgi:hypothetical protein